MKKIIFLIACACTLPFPAFGFELRAETRATSVSLQSDVVVDVKLSAREPVNAFEGHISYDIEAFDVPRISLGNTVANFWIEKPTITDRGIFFSGATPGGLSGGDNHLFSVVFTAKAEGVFVVAPESATLYMHDGKGTPLQARLHATRISVNGYEGNQRILLNDNQPPEDFTPHVSMSPDLFDGKYVLHFATQDKGSGISHYEIKEGVLGWYKKAESPYLLKHQTLQRTIYVRAYDDAGNVRTVILSAPHAQSFRLYWLVIFSFFFVCVVLLTILWKKYSASH
jgi:hypothetical protein